MVQSETDEKNNTPAYFAFKYSFNIHFIKRLFESNIFLSLNDIIDFTKNTNVQLATITGRYFAMDRDKRWERVKIAYEALVNSVGKLTQNPIEAIKNSYENNITDD